MSEPLSSENDKFGQQMRQRLDQIRKKHVGKRIGIVASCFDLLHTGHLIMLQDAKQQCDVLVVCLQTDPTIDRPHKNKPVQQFVERETMINAVRYIDEVIVYTTEYDYYNILKYLNPEIRILGSDWKGKKYTGYDLVDIPIHFHARTHSYSTSNLRKRIFEAESAKNK